VRENTDPDLTFTFEVTIDRNTAGFNLAIGDPIAPQALQTKFTKNDLGSTLRITGPATSLGLTVHNTFRHQRHDKISFLI